MPAPKKDMTPEARKKLDRILANRAKRKAAESYRTKVSVVQMERSLKEIWEYLFAPENKISNHDATNILKIIKTGLGGPHGNLRLSDQSEVN